MKTKLTPVIGSDFIGSNGERNTVFQLCKRRESDGRFASVANVHMNGDSVRCICIDPLERRKSAIIRLAGIYQQRSIPATFKV